MGIIVTLTDEEMEVAAHEGVRRRLWNLRRQSKPLRGAFKMTTTGEPPEPWKCDIEGACAEVAVCRVIYCHWSGINKQGVDVGRNTGVRHTPHEDGHLIIYADDPDERHMVLVTGTPPVLTVHGWIRARFAKLPKYYRDGRPKTEFWVPQSDLHPFTEKKQRTA